MANLQGLLSDPTFAMGVGLLSGAQPGGTLAGGMSNALQLGQQTRRDATKRQMMQMQMDELERQKAERERRQQMFDQMMGSRGQFTNIAPGSPEEFAAFDQPNYAGNVAGGVRMDEAPSGLLGNNPQMAQIMGLLGPEKGSEFMAKAAMQQMTPQEPTSAMQNYQYLLSQGIPEPEARQAAFGKMQINVGDTLPYDVPKNYMLNDPTDPSKGVSPIPGGPKDVQASPRSSTEATQIANARSAIKDLNTVKQMLFTPSGELKNLDAAAMGFGGIPGTSGRTARQSLRRSIETILRARSGSAVPPEEVNNYMDLYAPSMFDSDEEARDKIQRLEEFFSETLNMLQANPDTSRFTEDVE